MRREFTEALYGCNHEVLTPLKREKQLKIAESNKPFLAALPAPAGNHQTAALAARITCRMRGGMQQIRKTAARLH